MRLHHVQVAIPRGSDDEARRFWIDVIGFTEIPKPEPLRGRGGLWIRNGDCEIHLGVQDPFVAAAKAHPGVAVPDLDGLEHRLGLAGYETTSDEPIYGLRRLHVFDPFGNRIEFLGEDPS